MKRVNDRIIVSDEGCKSDIPKVFENWAAQKSEQRKCVIKDLGNCSFDVHDCVPEKAQRFLGLTPKDAGPNCHNLTLVMKGMVSSLVHTTPPEIKGYLEDSPLCRKLDNSESREPGDVGFITGETIFDWHSFTYLSDDVFLSKNGVDESPYGVFDSKFVLDGYNVPAKEECRQNTSPGKPECDLRVNYFRCMSMDDFLKGKELAEPYKEALKGLDDLERMFECRAMGEKKEVWKGKALAQGVFDALKVYVKDQKKIILNSDNKEEEGFLLGALALRLESLHFDITFYDQKAGYLENGNHQYSNFFKRKSDELRGKQSPFGIF